ASALLRVCLLPNRSRPRLASSSPCFRRHQRRPSLPLGCHFDTQPIFRPGRRRSSLERKTSSDRLGRKQHLLKGPDPSKCQVKEIWQPPRKTLLQHAWPHRKRSSFCEAFWFRRSIFPPP